MRWQQGSSLGADGGLTTRAAPFYLPSILSREEPAVTAVPESISDHQWLRVVSPVTAGTTPRQDLCAAHADGLTLFVSELGSHPAIGVASLFRSHLRLLGGNPAHWTQKPIG
jgi:hypothetical protein